MTQQDASQGLGSVGRSLKPKWTTETAISYDKMSLLHRYVMELLIAYGSELFFKHYARSVQRTRRCGDAESPGMRTIIKEWFP